MKSGFRWWIIGLIAIATVINYIDRKGRPKRVRYWTMIVSGGAESYSNEVDAMMWMSVDRARKKITYERDLLVIECFENFLRSGLTE